MEGCRDPFKFQGEKKDTHHSNSRDLVTPTVMTVVTYTIN